MKDGVSHKNLAISLKEKLDKSEIASINAFNQAFDPNDLKVMVDKKQLSIALRQVDVNLLEQVVAQGNGNSAILRKVADRILSVKGYGINSGKRAYVGYADERKVADRAEKVAKRGKHYYARDSQFSKAINSLPEKFVNSIVCGDSEQVLKRLPDNCIDMIFTSPPYNFGLDYDAEADDHRWPDYFDKLFKVFEQCVRVLKYGGRIIVNVQPLYSDYIPSHHMISNFFLGKKLIWKGEIVWEKNNYNCKYTAWGSWRSPSNPYLKYSWEFIEIYCKGDLKKEGNRLNADITADEFKKWVYGKWSIAPERKMKEYGHPAMFPEALADRIIRLFSFRNDVILDPFAGIGTTCIVAKRNCRKYLGIDIVEKYCDTAASRLSKQLEPSNNLGFFSSRAISSR